MTRLQIIKDTAENNYFTGNPGDGTYFIFDDSVDWLIAEAERLREHIRRNPPNCGECGSNFMPGFGRVNGLYYCERCDGN